MLHITSLNATPLITENGLFIAIKQQGKLVGSVEYFKESYYITDSKLLITKKYNRKVCILNSRNWYKGIIEAISKDLIVNNLHKKSRVYIYNMYSNGNKWQLQFKGMIGGL